VFDGNLILCSPTSDFVVEKTKVSGTFSKFSKLLFAQKKLFVFAIVGSIILTLLGIAGSQMYSYHHSTQAIYNSPL
jgi:ATP-binding cassette subfamily B protein